MTHAAFKLFANALFYFPESGEWGNLNQFLDAARESAIAAGFTLQHAGPIWEVWATCPVDSELRDLGTGDYVGVPCIQTLLAALLGAWAPYPSDWEVWQTHPEDVVSLEDADEVIEIEEINGLVTELMELPQGASRAFAQKMIDISIAQPNPDYEIYSGSVCYLGSESGNLYELKKAANQPPVQNCRNTSSEYEDCHLGTEGELYGAMEEAANQSMPY